MSTQATSGPRKPFAVSLQASLGLVLVLCFAAASFLLTGCANSSASQPYEPAPAPAINTFFAAPNVINIGGSTELIWDVTGATSVTLSGVTGPAVSPVTVSPIVTTTYTLTATNGTSSISANVTVTLPPVITSFTATPSNIAIGGSSQLSWTFISNGTDTVTLTGFVGTPTSPVTVSPTVTTSYTLTVSNAAGTASAKTTVTVTPGVTITSFTATPSSITAGQPVTLAWKTTNSTGVQISGVTGTLVSPIIVYPDATGTYILTATNALGSVMASAPVTVTSAPVIASATIGSTAGQLVPANFTGLGIGETSFEGVFGEPATGANPVLRQIVKNITQFGASPITYKVTADDVYPTSTYVPTAADISALSQLYTDVGATFFVGVNLAADNVSLAEQQATAFATMPAGSLLGLEIGNEPDNYTHSSEMYRTAPYAFLTDYANFAPGVLAALQASTQPKTVKLVGPDWGEPATTVGGTSGIVNNSGANVAMTDFLTAQSANLSFVTQHGYANQCISGGSIPTDFLLSVAAQDCVSTSYLLGGVAPTHADGLKYRIGETNSITGGGVLGISNTFQAALWAMDWSAGLAKGGVDGVNWFGDSSNQYYTMFTFNTVVSNGLNTYTLNYVTPQYYGVLLFQQATQNSAKFLPVTASATGNQVVYGWLDASNTIRILVLNKDESGVGTVTVTLPTGYGNGTLTRLVEQTPNLTPAYLSTTGVRMGGQTFDSSTDGTIQGSAYGETVTPVSGAYSIAVPVTSAVLITVPHS